jgi:hypothetical protein
LKRKLLREVATIVTPETLPAWHRRLIAQMGRGTIAEMLARHGVEPAPERKTSWKEFLRQHWDLIVAADFFMIEAWTPRGLQRVHRAVLDGVVDSEGGDRGHRSESEWLWMNQIGRNLTDVVDGILKGKRYLIHDCDP